MNLELGPKLINTLANNNEVKNFIKKLENALERDSISVYKDYDSTSFTKQNEEKLWDKQEKLISENITSNNIENAEKDKLYEISSKTSKGYHNIEFNGEYNNRKTIEVDYEKLPRNTESGMLFREVEGEYILDKQTTEKVYYAMKDYEKELINEQKEVLNEMRKEGESYKITYLEDDCETWRTELTNTKTGKTFQELDFPHEIYHHVGVDSLVKYENAKYNVVEGTSVHDLYPDIIENYCEVDGVYVTKDNKYQSVEELYASYNKKIKNENSIVSSLKDVLEKIVKFGIEKLLETIRKKYSKN